MAWLDDFVSKRREEKPEPWMPSIVDPDDPEIAALSTHDRDFFLGYLRDGGGWLNLISSNVESVSYNYADHTMDVTFNARRQNEKTRYYSYYQVSVQFFIDFVDANSHGKYVWNRERRPEAHTFTKYNF